MTKLVAQQLHQAAEAAAVVFSNPSRPLNVGETFRVAKEQPLSENTAAVLFRKDPSQKFALDFFYYVNTGGGQWRYFFVTYQHVAGMKQVEVLLAKTEASNYDKNFSTGEVPESGVPAHRGPRPLADQTRQG